MVNGIAEPSPLFAEIGKRSLSYEGQSVVAAGRSRLGFAPGGLDQAVTAQTGKQRVDRALACDQPTLGLQGLDQLKPVARLVLHQGHDAELEGPATHLTDQRDVTVGARYHVPHSSWPDKDESSGAGERSCDERARCPTE